MTSPNAVGKINRQAVWLWIVFAVVTGASVAGNAIEASPDWLSRVISGTPAVILFVSVEIVIHIDVSTSYDNGQDTRPRFVRGLVAVVGFLSFVVSYHHLQQLADKHGQGLASYAFPIFLDVLAILCTFLLLALQDARRRTAPAAPIRSADPAEPNAGGRPEEAGSVRWERKMIADRKAAGLGPIRPTTADRIITEYGPDPSVWPGPKDIAERLGISRSTASENRRKAVDLVGSSAS